MIQNLSEVFQWETLHEKPVKHKRKMEKLHTCILFLQWHIY